MKYIYPAIISKEGDGYLVDFPDFESCYTDGDGTAEVIGEATLTALYAVEKTTKLSFWKWLLKWLGFGS